MLPKLTAGLHPSVSKNMFDRKHLSRHAQWAGGETLVSQLVARELGHPDLVSLAVGFVDHQTLPIEPTRQALACLLSNDALARAALQYGATHGYLPLREAVVERMLAADGRSAAEINLRLENAVLMPGSNQLLFLLSDVLLDPGDIVLCAAPSYYVYLGALANLGARAIGIHTDDEGIVPEAVEEELKRLQAAGELDRVKAIYVTSYYDNPRGLTLPAPRRAALVEIAKRWSIKQRIYIIEDAAYRELRYTAPDVPSLRSFDREGDTVIYAGTFSKSFSPGIRVGWGILPDALAEPVLAEKGNLDFGSPHFNQVLMAEVMRQGLFDTHVQLLRAEYVRKIEAILAAAEEYLGNLSGVKWVRPSGGLYLWLQLPEGIDTGLSGQLFDRAIAEGVLYVPGRHCYPAERRLPSDNTLRLSFGCQSVDGLRRGVAALSRAIRQVI